VQIGCVSHSARIALGALTLVGTSACSVDSLAPVTTQASAISNLFQLVLWISAAVFLLVCGLLLFVIVRYRERDGDPEPTQIHGHRRLELAWTAAPFLLLVALFISTLQTMASVDSSPPDALRVSVIGHQWWWEYRYPDLGVVTANELHLPVGRPVRLDLTSADVIHSYWVPRFGWKRDVIPGKTNVLAINVEQPGVYDGTCTEFCGLQHAWMRVRVVAESQAEFNTWVEAQRQPAAAPQNDRQRRGQQLFASNTCVECHAIRGTNAVAQAGPDLTHVGSRTTLGSGVLDNGMGNLARFIKDAPSIKPGLLMPSFKTWSDDDVNAVAAYLDGLK